MHIIQDHPLEVRRPAFIQPKVVPARAADQVSRPAVTARQEGKAVSGNRGRVGRAAGQGGGETYAISWAQTSVRDRSCAIKTGVTNVRQVFSIPTADERYVSKGENP